MSGPGRTGLLRQRPASGESRWRFTCAAEVQSSLIEWAGCSLDDSPARKAMRLKDKIVIVAGGRAGNGPRSHRAVPAGRRGGLRSGPAARRVAASLRGDGRMSARRRCQPSPTSLTRRRGWAAVRPRMEVQRRITHETMADCE